MMVLHPMSHGEFSLTYDGPAVEDGTMDVRDLAPALLAVGQLFEAANRTLHGESSVARVQVRTVSPGSFFIGLDVSVTFLQSVRDLLAGPEATAAANLIGLLGGTGAVGCTAIRLVRWLKGRQPTSVKRKDGGRATIEVDGHSIEVDEPVARLALDVDVRLALERVIAEPLSKEGIQEVRLGVGPDVERIGKEEGYYFLAPPDREAGVFESRYRGPFSIVSLSFKIGNKWRLHDGKSALNVTVVDEDFLVKVNRNEVSFAKGDILICDVRVVTRQDASGGLKAEYFIERVVEHRSGTPRPATLFDEEPGS